MTTSDSRSRRSGPMKRLRRWSRHTPNGTMALNLMGLGLLLVLVAGILAAVLL